jgi:uncharacterized protein
VPGKVASEICTSRNTLNRYLELLTAVFLIKQIPAWSTGHIHRAIGTPKLTSVDSGLACHLLGQDAQRLNKPGSAAGSLMENFVLMELACQLTWSHERVRLHHYRTRDKVNVDAASKPPTARVIGIEVKAGSTFEPV